MLISNSNHCSAERFGYSPDEWRKPVSAVPKDKRPTSEAPAAPNDGGDHLEAIIAQAVAGLAQSQKEAVAGLTESQTQSIANIDKLVAVAQTHESRLGQHDAQFIEIRGELRHKDCQYQERMDNMEDNMDELHAGLLTTAKKQRKLARKLEARLGMSPMALSFGGSDADSSFEESESNHASSVDNEDDEDPSEEIFFDVPQDDGSLPGLQDEHPDAVLPSNPWLGSPATLASIYADKAKLSAHSQEWSQGVQGLEE